MTYAIQIAACVVLALVGIWFAMTSGAFSELSDSKKANLSISLSIALITLAILVRP